jgi:glycerophosphoryl diester phosphodiesterase
VHQSKLWQPCRAPWVIAHRGASGLLPEHTLPGYALAIEQGADVIEPDLLASRDGVLYARHDLGLARSTDVALRQEFASYQRLGPDGVSDWWIEDFDSGQLDQLRAIQPWPLRPRHRDRAYPIPRFSAVLALLLSERRRRERPVLVYPELKHPEHFLRLGIDLVALLAAELAAAGLGGADAPVVVQCFDRSCLDRVRELTGLRVVQLAADLPPLEGSAVDGYGVAKQALLAPAGRQFVDAAHARGRCVHAWTFRDDQPDPELSPVDEYRRAFGLGLDGVFSDFPATALAARRFVTNDVIETAASWRVVSVVGAAIAPYLQALAELRIRVFREWPYLYDGDLAYESHYLQTYSSSSQSLFVLAFDGERIVGCATAVPLCDESANCQAPFLAAGYDVKEILYFGESVLDVAYRGRGIGHAFFDHRERHALGLPGIRRTVFCAVERAPDDPRRPANTRSLETFWERRGYRRHAKLSAAFDWPELESAHSLSHPMVFWMREWLR